MKDRAMQALFLLAIDPVAETTADPHSYRFRRERSCADAMAQCFVTLATRQSAQWILEGDIKACFDRIDHDWLLSHVPTDTSILKKWLKSGYMEGRVLYPTEEGTPQGGPASPVLANLALDGLQRLLQETFASGSHKAPSKMVNLIRYADDFVITGRSKELLENEVKPLVAGFLAARGLELSTEKTSVTHIDTGFDFLGQNVRKYDGKLLITPSKTNVATFLANIREVVKAHKTTTAGNLVRLLNPKIKGWAMYHRHICAKRTFNLVDHALFQTLWHWCKRRHPNQGKRWIAGKYFTTLPGELGGDHWVFFGEVKGKDGEPRPIALTRTSCIPIRRHIKIRADVNPYSPDWTPYLERRHSNPRYRSSPAQGTRWNDI